MADSDYPYDGFERTGIKRLKWVEDVQSGEIKSNRLRPGAFYPLSFIKLNLVDRGFEKREDGLPELDPGLQSKVDGLFRGLNPELFHDASRYESRENRCGTQNIVPLPSISLEVWVSSWFSLPFLPD